MDVLTADLLVDAKADLGEGPVWDRAEGRLYWVDITRGRLHRYDPDGDVDRVYPVGQPIGCAVVRAAGGFMLGLQNGFAYFDAPTGSIRMLTDPEADHPDNRFNDGKVDPAGRFWAGTIGKPGTAALWRFDADGSVHRMLDGITCSNGLAWSADRKTFYYIDTPTRQIMAYDYEVETGAIANPRVAVNVPQAEGGPDGMAIDAEDKLWVGHWDGSQVVRWDPESGKPMQRVRVPAARTTSCAFGGEKNDTLYITTARTGLSEAELAKQPHAGGLFVVDPGVTGGPTYTFAGKRRDPHRRLPQAGSVSTDPPL